MKDLYDVIILGAGPAGLSAGIYAGRSRLSALLIEKAQDGGQIAVTDRIENYPGQQPGGEPGTALVGRMSAQVRDFGVERIADTISAVRLDGDVKELVGSQGTYRARTVILATGASHRPIGCKGEAEFKGRGVSYCATCDAAFFEGLEVFVVGGGDSAVQEALYLTKFARTVTIVHRRDTLRAVEVLQEKAFASEKIHFLWDAVVEEIGGGDVVQWLIVRNTKTGECRKIEADPADGMLGVFAFIGLLPATKLFEGIVAMEDGYVLTDEQMRTNIPGVFAAGDMRKKFLRQVVTAAADGAVAAMQAHAYLAEHDKE